MSIWDPLMGQYVLVGHGTWGLRAGILDGIDGTTARLRDSRHVFRFEAQPASAGCQGVDALCVVGPAKGSRIGPPVPECVVTDVRRVTTCTAEARAAFEAASWPR